MPGACVFRRAGMPFTTAVTQSGNTSIARLVGADRSRNLGAGLEILEAVTIDWTVTYDEVLFVFEGELTVEFDGERHDCTPGDIVWLPNGTTLRYVAKGRAAYFYALHPVDWARRQGVQEP